MPTHSYTANTAAFLTAKQQRAGTAQSIAELIARPRPACINSWDALYSSGKLQELYPGLQLAPVLTLADTLMEMRKGTCDAVIVPRFISTLWENDPSNCDLRIRHTIRSQRGGWAASPPNICLQKAFAVVVQEFLTQTAGDLMVNTYPSACKATTVTTNSNLARLQSAQRNLSNPP